MAFFLRRAKSVADIDRGEGQNPYISPNSQYYHCSFFPRGRGQTPLTTSMGGHGRICPPRIRHWHHYHWHHYASSIMNPYTLSEYDSFEWGSSSVTISPRFLWCPKNYVVRNSQFIGQNKLGNVMYSKVGKCNISLNQQRTQCSAFIFMFNFTTMDKCR